MSEEILDEEEFVPFTQDLEDMQIVLDAVRMVSQIESTVEPEELDSTTLTVSGVQLYEILELFLAFVQVYEGVNIEQLMEDHKTCLEFGARSASDTVH